MDLTALPFAVRAALVFLAMALTDVLFAIYIRRASQGRPFAAAVFGMFIITFGGFVAINYIDDHRLLVAAMLGSFLGTYVTVKLDIKKGKEKCLTNEPKK